MRAAQRQAAQQMNREIKRVNDQNRRAVADYNRKVESQNRKAIADYNRKVETHNQKAHAQNKRVVDDINRQLAAAGRPRVVYTQQEQGLVERVQEAVPVETRDYDLFLSYAGIDGVAVATELNDELRQLGLDVWFAPIAINPGKSQSLQMDQGLARARAGVVVLTPAYLAGRFWTQRELGAAAQGHADPGAARRDLCRRCRVQRHPARSGGLHHGPRHRRRDCRQDRGSGLRADLTQRGLPVVLWVAHVGQQPASQPQ